MNLINHTWIYRKTIPKRICNLIIQEGLNKPFQTAETGFSIKKKTSPLVNKKNLCKKIRNSNVNFFDNTPWIHNLINPYIIDANKNAGWNFNILKPETFQFTKYGINQHYHWHQDSFKNAYSSEHINAGLIRKLSVSLVLSDKNEYQGGDLNFAYQTEYNEIRNIKLNNLEIGTMVVFPSFLWHKVDKVKQGTRYSLVSWYLGEPLK